MSGEIEINDEETGRLVRELGAILGEDEETAILIAVRERLERLKKVAEQARSAGQSVLLVAASRHQQKRHPPRLG